MNREPMNREPMNREPMNREPMNQEPGTRNQEPGTEEREWRSRDPSGLRGGGQRGAGPIEIFQWTNLAPTIAGFVPESEQHRDVDRAAADLHGGLSRNPIKNPMAGFGRTSVARFVSRGTGLRQPPRKRQRGPSALGT
jgi:hypothetical protein